MYTPNATAPPLPTFRDLIAANKRRSALLVVAFCFFVPFAAALVVPVGIAAFAGPWLQSVSLAHKEVTPLDLCLLIAGLAGLLSVIYCLLTYQRGDAIILSSVAALPIEKDDNPELFHVVEEMSLAAGLPMPRIYMINDPAANALATGRDPMHATIAVTTGLQKLLTRDELQAVIAHEIAHIRNYDTRVMLLTATLVGSIGGICDFFLHIARCITGGRHDERCPRCLGLLAVAGIALTIYWLGPLAALLFCAVAAVLILTPVSAHVIQLAVSREREYLADASAVELTRYPEALADALWKLQHHKHRLRAVNAAVAHLFISNPLKRARGLKRRIFATHPSLRERVRRLAMLM